MKRLMQLDRANAIEIEILLVDEVRPGEFLFPRSVQDFIL